MLDWGAYRAPNGAEACADLADHVNLCAGGDEWACFGWAEALSKHALVPAPPPAAEVTDAAPV